MIKHDEFGREIIPISHFTTRVEVRVPCPDGSKEIVPARGYSLQDAVENAIVAYGDAELVFPLPEDGVYLESYGE